MVRWKQDNEGGGLQLPGTGYIWDNNVDTLHNMWTSIVSDRLLNEVRGQWSRYYDLRAAKCDCVQFNRTGYSIIGRRRDRHVGRHPRRHLGRVGHAVAVARQPFVQDGRRR